MLLWVEGRCLLFLHSIYFAIFLLLQQVHKDTLQENHSLPLPVPNLHCIHISAISIKYFAKQPASRHFLFCTSFSFFFLRVNTSITCLKILLLKDLKATCELL